MSIVSVPLPQQKIHRLFGLIHKHHTELGTSPKKEYDLLRTIIQDRDIVSGKQEVVTFMEKLEELKAKYNKKAYHTMFAWMWEEYQKEIAPAASQSKNTSDSVSDKDPKKLQKWIWGVLGGALVLALIQKKRK